MGLMGPQGPIGPTGATGATGATGQGFAFRNAFDGGTDYNAYDTVTYNGSTYEATTAIPNGQGTPDMNPAWALMAKQGATGPTGQQGPQGDTGATGAIGAQGPIGPQGPTGPQGQQGPQGDTGATGAIGAQGPIGPQGPTGPQGQQGDMGLMGPQGPIGPTGATGATGATGQGFTFRNAFDGGTDYNAYDAVTYNGSTYEATTAIPNGQGTPDMNPAWALMAKQGATGPTGQQGPQGDTGATGATGQQGPKGDTGATGATGPQGPKGDTGATGAIGPQGPKGDTGATGAIGPQGPQGPQGPPGSSVTTRTWLFSYQGVCQAGATSAPINFPSVNAPSYLPCAGTITPEWQIPAGNTSAVFWVKLRVPTGHTGAYTLTTTFRSSATGSATLQPSVACVAPGQVPDNPPFSTAGINSISLFPAGGLQNVTATGSFTPSCTDGADLYVMFTFPANSVASPINFSYVGLAVQGAL